ncbi:hypothetical protein CNMCM5793_008331 [Aspergillus hiratsukae]|uniref:FluG domain-containing protein n=2 Tax=Aspergillus subgen. Fumigati TaxID=2720872 RepID=A0A8H6P6S5_9EURO|nr:hypothetical protein CNMCM5793_008331 [Aspergillus hiratsukae]KAH1646711.1 hypothetical protein KXX59_007627 [Aspergillus fumigatus]KAH1892646.1 hypothetical protein KXV57_003719 [Aspergillus fumigatus]KAH1992839.1 hypothetical protein KXV33_005120 [Aspergillus fumigatus]
MAFLGLPKTKPQHHGNNKGSKSYLHYAKRRQQHIEAGPTLPQYAPRTNLSAASVRGKWHRFCADTHQNPDALLRKLKPADVKSWFDWIEDNFSGSIKAHGTLTNYWRTLKRLYFMKNKKDMSRSMINDCINYMNEVSKRMRLRKLPLPKDTENSLDLLSYQTAHLVHCKAVFPDEKQRLYHMATLNLSSVTACRAVSLFDTRCQVDLHPDGSPAIPRKIEAGGNGALNSPTPGQSGEAHCDSGYESSRSGRLNVDEDDMLDEISSDGSSDDTMSDIGYVSDCSSVVTDDGYLAGDDQTGTILWRHVEFCIARNPEPGRPNILFAIVTLIHTKGEDRKPRIKRFVIEHEDNLLFDLLSQLLALAWDDGIFAANFKDVEDIYTYPIPSHRRGMHLKIKREWLDVPIFREPERTDEGYRTSSKTPMKAATSGRYLKRTGEQTGQKRNLTQKCLRRGGINAINNRAPASVRDQVADHESNAVKYYLNEIVDFDTAAAFHRRVSNEIVQRELRSATLLADNTVPLGLTDEQKRKINQNPEVRRLRSLCRRLTEEIRAQGYRRLRDAAETELGEKKRQADAQLTRKLTELRQKAKSKNRKRHFRYKDTELFNQRDEDRPQPQERDPQAHSPHYYQIPERAELVQLLFYSPAPTTEEELYERRLRYIRLLVRWQYRQEAPRRGKQAEATIAQPRPTPASPSLAVIPERYDPLQCPFCLANPGLPPDTRVKKKSKRNKLWDHVENLHRAELAAFGTGTKRCGLCGMRSIYYLPSSVPEFKNHTERVHGIRLRG